MGKHEPKKEEYIKLRLVKPQLGWTVLSRAKGADLSTVVKCGPGTPYTGMPGMRPVLVHVGELVPLVKGAQVLGMLDADTELFALHSDDIPFVVMPPRD